MIKAIHEKKLTNLTVISSEGGVKFHGLDLLIESRQVLTNYSYILYILKFIEKFLLRLIKLYVLFLEVILILII